MNDYLRNILQYNCQIETNSPVVIGVSGGPDSLFLLNLLLDFGAQVVIGHLDHGLRPEATEEANFVENIAKEKGIEFFAGKVDVNYYAQKKGMSIEEAARILRYRFLFEHAKRMKAHAVAVGHNADDQVETMLMNLLRGSGMKGLAGMDYRLLPSLWSDEIPLVRPLLGIWRQEIEEYLASHNIKPILDPSNRDISLLRNRIRLEIIPFLEKQNLLLRESLWRTTEIIRAEDKFLLNLSEDAWEKCIEAMGLNWIAFSRKQFLGMDIAIKRRLLIRAFNTLLMGSNDVNFSMIERGISIIEENEHSKSIDLALGLYIRLESDRVWIATWDAELPIQEWPQIRPDSLVEVFCPGCINLEDGWFLQIKEISADAFDYDLIYMNIDLYQAWIDANQVNPPLYIRTRRGGDRFQPLGMEGHHVKLSDLMINLKMPVRSRQRWPLICDQKNILWIPGYRVGSTCQVNADTKKIYHLVLSKANVS